MPPVKPAALTPRELEVLLVLAGGASNARIARELGISLRTVKVHVAAIFRALDVDDRTAATVVALRRRLIRLPDIRVVHANDDPHDGAPRVLVVDDDEGVRQLLSVALGDDGYEALEAPDGLAALTRARRWRPDVILLDLVMPGMDGATFAERYAASRGPHAPILVLTGAGPGAERAALQLPGVTAALPKPLSLVQLQGELRRLLNVVAAPAH